MTYSPGFYDKQIEESRLSAERVVPVMVELLRPESVIDLGCGGGGWSSEFMKAGCRVIGIDGDYVPRDRLLIPEECFIPADLERCSREGCVPGLEDRRFSLALSVEVAEHLPSGAADGFVDLLTGFADTVAFSAAIPHQGGTHHVNEQWPDYWVDLFSRRDYRLVDILRPRIWDDGLVEPWYRQNLLLFVKDGTNPFALPSIESGRDPYPVRLVHPDFWERAVRYFNSDEHILRQQPAVLARALAGIVRRRLASRMRALLKRFVKRSG